MSDATRDAEARTALLAADAPRTWQALHFWPKKPSTAAWAVNQLVRHETEQVDQVLAVGEALREAQRTLDGEELRALTRQRRQKAMARWLMPFGFLAGLTFTKITTLTTFDSFGPWGQPVIGGLLGMGSGLMGSYAAAASVNSENEDGVRILRNRREEGRWLLLMETPSGIDLPWQTVQRSRPLQVVRLSEQ